MLVVAQLRSPHGRCVEILPRCWMNRGGDEEIGPGTPGKENRLGEVDGRLAFVNPEAMPGEGADIRAC